MGVVLCVLGLLLVQVDATASPSIGSTAVLPGVVGPGVISELTRAWNGSKTPNLFARMHVKSANITWRRFAWSLSAAETQDDQVAKNRRS